MEYKPYRIIDGKPRWVIVDGNRNIINKNPRKEELENLEDENCRRNRCEKYIDDELLNYLRIFYEKNGRIPSSSDFIGNPEYPSFRTYQRRFGSWKKALKQVGMDKQNKIYTDDELLNYLKDFYQENGRVPIQRDFENNPEYPSFDTYRKRFGTWNKALKRVGFDIDIMVKQGSLLNSRSKGRSWEILIIEHFKNYPTDLSGDNMNSPCDGICPNGKTYDAKSSRLNIEYGRWSFGIKNKYKEEIEIFYLGAFNEDYTKLMHVWRVPGEIIETNNFHIGMHTGKFNVENMKEYEITDKFNIF